MTDVEALIAAGEAALRARARELQMRSDIAELVRVAEALLAGAPPSLGRPMAAAFLFAAREHDRAAALYEAWLEDAEAPAAWHLANLAASHRKRGDAEGVRRAVARFHPWDLDPDARRTAARALAAFPATGRTLRVALMCTFTADQLEPSLRVGAAALGLSLELYVGEMDLLRAEIADPASGLYAFAPDVVILGTTWRDLEPHDPDAQADAWMGLWRVLLDRTSAQVLQHTFDTPPHAPLGHLDASHGLALAAARINARFAEATPARVSLVDHAGAVARFGAERWCDPRQWAWAKQAVTPEAAPVLVEEILAVLRALTGRAKKVLVLDLDHTLWGGVVGEDGVAGLSIGPPSAEGEAHQALQRYAKALERRGVLLAVCSKNNPEDARAPFEQLDDMVLRLDDFVAFEASWDPKPDRIRAMAATLELGLDSFVFVDDNPAERARVRRELPEVLVVPLPADPSGYVAALHRARAFEALAISTEDAGRTAQYRAESERRELRIHTSPEDYYRSLEMVATIRPFGPGDFTRIVQLAARSNQFNLTTWRLTPAEVASLAASERHVCRTVRIADRYGDYGLVMVVVAERQGDTLDIQALFMSCRVIARTVEQLALVELDRAARARGCTMLRGTYVPTAKNRRLVAGLYGDLGFECTETREDGTTVWRRAVDPGNPVENPWIAIHREE
ncbi:MAG: HAD-IIIC family phosphatase [Alphaproteobacteria bacterium]|nr:HAD-IIIC family phosphatase [Alphaproteobacteria bacterium]